MLLPTWMSNKAPDSLLIVELSCKASGPLFHAIVPALFSVRSDRYFQLPPLLNVNVPALPMSSVPLSVPPVQDIALSTVSVPLPLTVPPLNSNVAAVTLPAISTVPLVTWL